MKISKYLAELAIHTFQIPAVHRKSSNNLTILDKKVQLTHLFIYIITQNNIFHVTQLSKQNSRLPFIYARQEICNLFRISCLNFCINKMADINRISNIHGSMNSMYFVDTNRPSESRFIRVQGTRMLNSNLQGSYSFENFNQPIVISPYTAWILLFISVIFSAFVPCWLLADIKSQGFTRNSWRFLTVSVLLLPFVMYEQRNKKSLNQSFINQLTRQKITAVFVSTINYCIWLLCLVYACRFTSINHAVCLACLRFFFSSLMKIKRGETIHQFQIAGILLCTLGIILILSDSLALSQQFGPQYDRYRRIQPWKRLILGDGLSFLATVVSYYLDRSHHVPDMPRFSYLFMYNLFLSFNLVTFGYFFGGNQFTFNTKFGVFGFYTYSNFVSIFYVSVMLGLYLMIANILIDQIFNDVIINVGSTFQLIICAIAWHLLHIQRVPSGMTCLGYAFLTPGLIFIIGGQGALQNKQNKINFQLYRPTEVNQSMRTGLGKTNLKGSISLERQVLHQNLRKTQISKYFERNPFEMIIQEDLTEEKYGERQ